MKRGLIIAFLVTIVLCVSLVQAPGYARGPLLSGDEQAVTSTTSYQAPQASAERITHCMLNPTDQTCTEDVGKMNKFSINKVDFYLPEICRGSNLSICDSAIQELKNVFLGFCNESSVMLDCSNNAIAQEKLVVYVMTTCAYRLAGIDQKNPKDQTRLFNCINGLARNSYLPHGRMICNMYKNTGDPKDIKNCLKKVEAAVQESRASTEEWKQLYHPANTPNIGYGQEGCNQLQGKSLVNLFGLFGKTSRDKCLDFFKNKKAV